MSEKSDPGTRSAKLRIDAHFALRGSSLRKWATAWAAAHTQPDGTPYRPSAIYSSVRMVIARWSDRDGFPQEGTLGRTLWIDLGADVGRDILPWPSRADAAIEEAA